MSMIAKKRQAGVGLIEVLVTLLILAVGLLGLAGLQNAALRYNHVAYLESQAQFLVRDIVERMRASGKPELYVIRFGEASPNGPDCKTQNCSTPRNLADWELEEWIATVTAQLPGSAVQIERTDPITNEFTITVRYNDIRARALKANGEPVEEEEEEGEGEMVEDGREVTVVTRI